MNKERLNTRKHPEGIVFKVLVQPRSSKNSIAGIHNEALKIKLTAPPVDNAANQMCLKFLAKSLRVSRSALEIIAGHNSRQKQILLRPENTKISANEYKHLVNLIENLATSWYRMSKAPSFKEVIDWIWVSHLFNANHENHKHQNPNLKQIPMTQIQNSKHNDPPAFGTNGLITGGQRSGQQYGTTAVNVLVIGYWYLRFTLRPGSGWWACRTICNLELGIWDFNVF